MNACFGKPTLRSARVSSDQRVVTFEVRSAYSAQPIRVTNKRSFDTDT